MTHPLITKHYGKGVPVVLIHGWGLNSAVWQPTIQQLDKTLAITTIDLPGFGLNLNDSLSPYSLIKVVDKIQEALQENPLLEIEENFDYDNTNLQPEEESET